MARNYPHLSDTPFPDLDSVDVYKYENTVDYSRWNKTQMTMHALSVPWDLGSVQIGQRLIEGIGNVVYFGSDAKRDAWFSKHEDYVWQTRYRSYHDEDTIKIPLPYDVACRYNYIWCEYELEPSADMPIEYESAKGVHKMYWFIRSLERDSPNSTVCHVKRDTWTTYINDIAPHIKYMMLDRGHWPVAHSSVDKLLKDPAANSEYLLAPDADFGEASQVKDSDAAIINTGQMWALIYTTANPSSSVWGSKSSGDWRTPSNIGVVMQGGITVHCIAIEVAELTKFLSNIQSMVPQFIQTIKGICYVPKVLTNVVRYVTFAGIQTYTPTAVQETLHTFNLEKGSFGYDAKYANLAKLYTSPYAHLEITDDAGGVTVVKIEDIGSSLEVKATLNLIWPFVSVDAFVNGTGGPSKGYVTFRTGYNLGFHYAGKWYETLRHWGIPMYEVTCDAGVYNDYATHYDRAQMQTAASNALGAAQTAYQNNYNSAVAQYTAAYNNEVAGADAGVSNTATQNAANTAITARSAEGATADVQIANMLTNSTAMANGNLTVTLANNQIKADQQSANIAGTSAILGSAVNGAVAGAAAGSVVPGVGTLGGAVFGAMGGLISGTGSAVVASAQTSVATNLTSAQAEAQKSNITTVADGTTVNALNRTDTSNNTNTDNTATQNGASLAIAQNMATVAKANAARTRNAMDTTADNAWYTEKAAADAAYNTATSAISNQIKQARLNAPYEFGEPMNGETAPTRPMGLWCNVVTEPDYAIGAAGDTMLKYGYTLNRWVEFDGFNVMPRFSYWKASELSVEGLTIPDAYMDEIRFYLMGGVTVWSNPDFIGKTSIYDN